MMTIEVYYSTASTYVNSVMLDFNGCVLFLYEGIPRTDETLRLQTNHEHHTFYSAFLYLNIDMV
jgi:hypothetical protein